MRLISLFLQGFGPFVFGTFWPSRNLPPINPVGPIVGCDRSSAKAAEAEVQRDELAEAKLRLEKCLGAEYRVYSPVKGDDGGN
jgi:hypothetical protein